MAHKGSTNERTRFALFVANPFFIGGFRAVAWWSIQARRTDTFSFEASPLGCFPVSMLLSLLYRHLSPWGFNRPSLCHQNQEQLANREKPSW